jgi:hypothetical protein
MSAFTTIARAFKGGLTPKPARAYLIPLNIFAGDEPQLPNQRTFQYFPATLSDSQPTNYQAKVIPGLSHPLYQWTSGSARQISFEAIFTRDRTYTSEEQQSINTGSGSSRDANVGSYLNAMGGAVFAFLGAAQNTDPRNVDIPSAIAWLRSFLLPEYSTDGGGTFSGIPERPRPPQKLILGLPGVRLNWGVPTLPAHEVYVIMTGCEVTYDGFFHDGSPRMAKVQLTFAEIIQVGGRIIVQDGGTKRAIALAGYTLNDNGTKGK